MHDVLSMLSIINNCFRRAHNFSINQIRILHRLEFFWVDSVKKNLFIREFYSCSAKNEFIMMPPSKPNVKCITLYDLNCSSSKQFYIFLTKSVFFVSLSFSSLESIVLMTHLRFFIVGRQHGKKGWRHRAIKLAIK